MGRSTFFAEDESPLLSKTMSRVEQSTATPMDEDLVEELRVSWGRRVASKTSLVSPPRKSLAPLLVGSPVRRVRKDNVFKDDLTQEENELVKKRTAKMQEQREAFDRREREHNVKVLREMFQWVTKEEARMALEMHNGEQNEVVAMLQDPSSTAAILQIRQMVATGGKPKKMPASAEEDVMIVQKHKKSKKKKGIAGRELHVGPDVPPEVAKIAVNLRKKMDSAQAEKKYVSRRLHLDEALKRTDSFEGWSPARFLAYQATEKNPNTYYYRFNAPGEEQRGGDWSKEEHDLFLKRIEEVGIGKKWGIFSMAIPGRVGYQCSNYYRKLLESGKLKDDAYMFSPLGKVAFVGNNERKIRKFKDLGYTYKVPGKASVKRHKEAGVKEVKRRKVMDTRIIRKDTSDAESDDDFRPPNTAIVLSVPKANEPPLLPGLVDPITLDPITDPAISPYGHVMNYDSWSRCLSSQESALRGTCPFTKKPLNKREIHRLTKENIEEYRNKIVSIM